MGARMQRVDELQDPPYLRKHSFENIAVHDVGLSAQHVLVCCAPSLKVFSRTTGDREFEIGSHKILYSGPTHAPSLGAGGMLQASGDLYEIAARTAKIFEAPSAIEALSSREFCTPYSPSPKYYLSKLLNILFTQTLSNHLPPTHPTITANCINPGFCHSELARGVWNPVFLLFRFPLARPAEEGARQLIWGSVGVPDESQGGVESLEGAYVHFSKVTEPSDFVISKKGQEFKDILWSDTVKILLKVDPRVQSIVDRYLRH
ncbi:hypothetical protein PLEOSDRAFT_154716 [Pleurotus ostreatus PC15]|uniref:Uncharacterized protein n=1 Tax=Pleurotus ostreatus (strain PC15) TaxID=1137138 RepID=A0A067NPJ5_PLEO1|nr:hypothetical protein PLEOSDRAFT_154716 [Pleurotus ostreatus PC15]